MLTLIARRPPLTAADRRVSHASILILILEPPLICSRFYAPWCGHCKNLKPAWEKAAKSLEGMVNVVAVNCDADENKALCGQQGIQGFPTLKTFRMLTPGGKPIVVPYQGERSAKAIVETGKALLPNHVKRVEDKDLATWLADKNETAKAILFSDKGKTPAQLKALANDFLGNLNVAQIRDKDQEAATTFGIDDYPTLVVLPGGDKEPVKYDGEMNMAGMAKFISQYADVRTDMASGKKASKPKDTKAKSSKASKSYEKAATSHAKEDASEAARSAASETLEDPDAESPKPTLEDVPKPVHVPTSEAKPLPTLGTQMQLQETCLSAGAATCLLALLPPVDEDEPLPAQVSTTLANLATLRHKLSAGQQHIFPFYVVPGNYELADKTRKLLSLSADGVEVIAVNGKKKWWRQYDSAKGFEVAAVENWIDGIKFGEVKKQKLPIGLLGEAAQAAQEEDKSEL